MNEKDLEQISLDFIIEKFGKEYIEKMNGKVCLATGKCTDDMYQYFVGFKGQKEYPPKGKVFRGWSVYALVYLDVHTGEIISFNYQTE